MNHFFSYVRIFFRWLLTASLIFNTTMSQLGAEQLPGSALTKPTGQIIDITFPDGESLEEDREEFPYDKVVDKIMVEVGRISGLINRQTLMEECGESGCPIDSAQCDAVYAPAECSSGGTLDGDLDMCVLPADVECPSGYVANDDYTLCIKPPECQANYTYDATNDICVSMITTITPATKTYSCPDENMNLNGEQCCYPEEESAPIETLACESGGVLTNVGESVCPNGGVLNGNICEKTCTDPTYHCPNGGTLSGITCSYAPSCPSGSNFPGDCSGNYPVSWIKDMYTGLLNRCPDQSGYNHWLNYANAQGYTGQDQLRPLFCTAAAENGEPCGSATPDANMCYSSSVQDVSLQTPEMTTSGLSCPSGGTLLEDGVTCDNTCSYPNYYCPSGGSLSGSTCLDTCSSGYYYCPSGGTLSGSTCNTTTTYAATHGVTEGGCSENPIEGYPYHYNTTCGVTPNGRYNMYIWFKVGYSCPSGGTLSGSTCIVASSYAASYGTSTYSCNYGASVSSYTSYDCDYSASCPGGTSLPSNCSGNYPVEWVKEMYTGLLNRCPDQAGYDNWLNYANAQGYTSQAQLYSLFCASAAENGEPCGSSTPDADSCYGSTQGQTTIPLPVTISAAPSDCPNGGNLVSGQCQYTAEVLNLNETDCSYPASQTADEDTTCDTTCYTDPSCPSGGSLIGSTQYACPDGGSLSGSLCVITKPSTPSKERVGSISGYYDDSSSLTMCWTDNGTSACGTGNYTGSAFSFANNDISGGGTWSNGLISGSWSAGDGTSGTIRGFYDKLSISGGWYEDINSCQAGYTLIGNVCTYTFPATSEYNNDTAVCDKTCSYNTTSYYCPSGGTLSGTTCLNTCSYVSYSCPSGGSLSGSTCHLSSTCYYNASEYGCHNGGGGYTIHFSYKCGVMRSDCWDNGCDETLCGGTSFIASHLVGVEETSTYSATPKINYYPCNYPASSTTVPNYYDCSYDASAGSEYDCSYSPSSSSSCLDGSAPVNGQCQSQSCTVAQEDTTCPSSGMGEAGCDGNYPEPYILSLYTNHLCRCPDQEGYDHWLNFISKGNTWVELVKTFKLAAAYNGETWRENCTSISNDSVNQSCEGNYPDDFILAQYTGHLCRCPDQEGYDHWLSLKEAGKSYEWIASAINRATLRPDNIDVWVQSCSQVNTESCYSSTPIQHAIQCPTDASFIYNNTIQYNTTSDQCESQIKLECGGSSTSGYTYSSEERVCLDSPICGDGEIYDESYNVCIESVICPLGDNLECYGPLDNAYCSPWICNDDSMCGYAYCDNLEIISQDEFMPEDSFAIANDGTGSCTNMKCDLTQYREISYCGVMDHCPSGFGIVEEDGICYAPACPEGTYEMEGKCYKE